MEERLTCALQHAKPFNYTLIAPGLPKFALTNTLIQGEPKQKQTQQHAAKSKKPDLPVAQLDDLGKCAFPATGRQKGHQTLNDQHQSQRSPQGIASQKLLKSHFLPAAPALEAPPRMALKNSDELGSSTITSLFLLKLALYASKLR